MTTRIPLLQSGLVSGSVRPLMKGKQAKSKAVLEWS